MSYDPNWKPPQKTCPNCGFPDISAEVLICPRCGYTLTGTNDDYNPYASPSQPSYPPQGQPGYPSGYAPNPFGQPPAYPQLSQPAYGSNPYGQPASPQQSQYPPNPYAQPAYAPARPRVFVSHSHANDPFTKKLSKDLQDAGVDVWVDMVNMSYGNFMMRINEALSSCEWLVLVLTPEALASPAVKWEVDVSLNMLWQQRMKGVIPVLAERCDLNQMPPTWSVLHYIDATKDYRAALANLLRALGVA